MSMTKKPLSILVLEIAKIVMLEHFDDFDVWGF